MRKRVTRHFFRCTPCIATAIPSFRQRMPATRTKIRPRDSHTLRAARTHNARTRFVMAIFGGKQLRAPTTRRGSLRRPASGTSSGDRGPGCSPSHFFFLHFSTDLHSLPAKCQLGERDRRQHSEVTLVWKIARATDVARDSLVGKYRVSLVHLLAILRENLPRNRQPIRIKTRNEIVLLPLESSRARVHFYARVSRIDDERARTSSGRTRNSRTLSTRDELSAPEAWCDDEIPCEIRTLESRGSSPGAPALALGLEGGNAHFTLPWTATRFNPLSLLPVPTSAHPPESSRDSGSLGDRYRRYLAPPSPANPSVKASGARRSSIAGNIRRQSVGLLERRVGLR